MILQAQAPTYHALLYSYVPEILEKRGPHREEHLSLAKQKVRASWVSKRRIDRCCGGHVIIEMGRPSGILGWTSECYVGY